MSKQLIINGECLEEMKKLGSGSFDLILTDPPYGTIKGLGGDIEKYKRLSNSTWDVTLDNKEMFKECKRLLRKNGKLILFSQEPYTSKLIVEADRDLPFAYRLVWLKDHFANCLVVNKAPVSYFEDIIVFVKNFESENNDDNPCKEYAVKVFNFLNKSRKELKGFYGNNNLAHFNSNGKQFRLCAKQTYINLIRDFDLKNMEGFLEYETLAEMNRKYKESFMSVFNLSEGKKIKSNVLSYKKDYGGLHPTQKPVELLKDLIKTYSNEGDKVLDFTAGSFSTLVACEQTNRNGTGIEISEEYCEIGRKRLGQLILDSYAVSEENASHESNNNQHTKPKLGVNSEPNRSQDIRRSDRKLRIKSVDESRSLKEVACGDKSRISKQGNRLKNTLPPETGDTLAINSELEDKE